MAGRKKGTPKTGGRQKGSLNKVTSDIKTKISIILDKELERIDTTLAGLEPNDRASFILKLLQYTIPKLSTNHIAVTEKDPKPEFKGFEFLPTIKPKKRL